MTHAKFFHPMIMNLAAAYADTLVHMGSDCCCHAQVLHNAVVYMIRWLRTGSRIWHSSDPLLV